MKHKIRTCLFFFLILLTGASFLLSSCGKKEPAASAETDTRTHEEILQDTIEELLIYHGTYGDKSKEKEDELLAQINALSPSHYEKWNKIMDIWRSGDNAKPVNPDILPDGLADTDELCLIALGFQLMPDGTMKKELVERLKVLKASAEKYPNALIVCTGGGTAAENKAATEAGRMAEWLIDKGIDKDRIIVEDRSITTAQNAIFTYDILQKAYPQVNQLAIISSDYHIATGALLFDAEAVLRAEKTGEEKMKVVSNAAYPAPTGTLSSMFQAGALIELSGDKETAFDIYYETYDIHSLPPLD